jgi:hypothetical protein
MVKFEMLWQLRIKYVFYTRVLLAVFVGMDAW